MYAVIINGVVSAVFEELPALGPRECAQIVECGEDTQVGWRFEGGECVDPTLEDKLAEIEAKYKSRLKNVADVALAAFVADGAGMEQNLETIRAEWQCALDCMDSETMQLLEGL